MTRRRDILTGWQLHERLAGDVDAMRDLLEVRALNSRELRAARRTAGPVSDDRLDAAEGIRRRMHGRALDICQRRGWTLETRASRWVVKDGNGRTITEA